MGRADRIEESEVRDLSVSSSDAIRLSTDRSEAIVALSGAQPVLWQVDGRELLWNGDPAHWSWHAPVLFPIVGQVNGGRVRIDGHSYAMPRHGFARTSRFQCVERSESSVRLRLTKRTAETDFPLPFQFDVIVNIGDTALSVAFVVHNPGAGTLPYAVGFHPAFPCPFAGGNLSEYAVQFEQAETTEVPVITREGLFGKSRRTIPLEGRRLSLEKDLFRDDALVFLDARSRSLRFEAPSGAAISMRSNTFRHWAIWTKPGAPFLSLEAWSGHADPDEFRGDFAQKPSMILLEPGAERHHEVVLGFEPPDLET